MNILVCVKQVPDTNEIKIDPETNTLVRDGVPSIVNTFDGYALEAAARIKDNDPDPPRRRPPCGNAWPSPRTRPISSPTGPSAGRTPWPPATSSPRPSGRWRTPRANST